MKIFLLSNPTDILKEHDLINALMEKGIDYFHLRKPEHSKEELENYLKKIKSTFYRRISIHSHYSLIEKYNLGGIHLPEKVRNNSEVETIIRVAKKKGLNVSTSAHALSQLEELKQFSYVFLSPVFDSISKPGYTGSIDLEAFENMKRAGSVKTKVVALGGIGEGTIQKIKPLGFDGVALMGSLWQDYEKNSDVKSGVENLLKITRTLNELNADEG